MSRMDKPSVNDWLKLGGLVLAISIAAFDVIFVRAKNKTLSENIEKQAAERNKAVEAAERKASEDIERSRRLVKDAEKRISESRRMSMEAQKESREKLNAQMVAHRKALDEQREVYEKRMREMQEEFNRRMSKTNERNAQTIENLTEWYNERQKARNSSESNLNDTAGRQKEDEKDDLTKMSRAEKAERLKANRDEIDRLIKGNPGCVLVPSDKQARILETRFATAAQRRYCHNGQITYVREHYRCTNCDRDRIGLQSGDWACCEVSAKRSYSLWRDKRIAADESAKIKDRIDELRKENAELKKMMQTQSR